MRAVETIKNIWKIEDLRNRILTTLLLVAIYRFGTYVVLPGIDPKALTALQEQTRGGLLALLDMFSGGAFSNASIFALGIMPYISASIVMQLMAIAVPSFQKLQREGESGRRKINQWTRYLTVAILLFQGPTYLVNLSVQLKAAGAALPAGIWFTISSTVILAAGSMFILWLGERITDKGVGNGISIVLLINIISGMPSDFATLYSTFVAPKTPAKGVLAAVIILAILIVMVVLVCFLQDGERRIPVQYSQKVSGRRTVGGQSTNIPLKVNTAGVMPIIFASSLMQFPVIIAQLFGKSYEWTRYLSSSYWCRVEAPKYSIGLLVYIVLLIIFAYFYTSITFNPIEVADNLKKAGGVIPGITPGKSTSEYLNKILNYIVFIGAVGLLIIALIPIMCTGFFNASVSFGGTSIIIIVGVVLETLKQIESQMCNRYYKGFLSE